MPMIEVLPNDIECSAGVNELSINLADIPVRLDAAEPRLFLRPPMDKFAVSANGEPEVKLDVAWRTLDDVTNRRKLFDSGSLWQLYADDNDYLIRLAGPRTAYQPYKIVRFNHDFTRGEIACEPRFHSAELATYPLEYPLDEVFFIHLLARGRGVELHGCGLTDEVTNTGLLFLGESGAGKTTTARLWQRHAGGGIDVLSDDRIIVRADDAGDLWMYGTPWHGEAEISSPRKAQLTHIFFLRHATHNQLTPQTLTEATARLFACAFPLFYDPECLDFTLEFLERTATSLPVHELGFIPDERVINFVRRAIL